MYQFKNLSPQTKSFIILFLVALLGTYLTVMVSQNSLGLKKSGYRETNYSPNGIVASASNRFMPSFSPVDTSAWQTYHDKTYPISFMYKSGWSVSTKNQDGFYIIQIDPGAKYYNMSIYVSDKEFYGIEGLPSIETQVNGVQAFNVSNLLYGIKMGPNYYSFDNGLSTNMLDNFNALVRTVKFQ